jgi:hypothetical protein
MMKRLRLNVPQMMFVIGTRAALAGGLGLLISERLEKRQRRTIGWILAGVGAVTTLPAAMMLFRHREGCEDAASA